MNDVNTVIAKTVRAKLAIENESIEDLASKAGIKRTTLYRKLTGKSGWKAQDVIKVAQALECSLEDLYAGYVGTVTGQRGTTRERS